MTTNEDKRSAASSTHLPQNTSNRRVRGSKSTAGVVARHSDSGSDVTMVADARDERRARKRECDCGPDLYSKVLGPTADETILIGLRTVIDLCSKMRVCREIPPEDNELDTEPVHDVPRKESTQTYSNEVKSSVSQTDRKMMVSAGFQVNPSVKTVGAQTAPFPEVVSEILQTSGFSPEMVSKLMQTSFIMGEGVKPSVTSIFMQTSDATVTSGAMQTSNPQMKSGMVQTSAGLLPTIPETHALDSATTQTEELRSRSIQTMSRDSSSRTITNKPSEPLAVKSKTFVTEQAIIANEHKCISPSDVRTCKCCRCSSSSSIAHDRKDSQTPKEKPTKTCVCDSKKKAKCKCEPPAGPTTETDQTPPLEIRYAITKISKYSEFWTFEVMKSTKNEPRQMPRSLESVFVLKKKEARNGSKNGVINEPQVEKAAAKA